MGLSTTIIPLCEFEFVVRRCDSVSNSARGKKTQDTGLIAIVALSHSSLQFHKLQYRFPVFWITRSFSLWNIMLGRTLYVGLVFCTRRNALPTGRPIGISPSGDSEGRRCTAIQRSVLRLSRCNHSHRS